MRPECHAETHGQRKTVNLAKAHVRVPTGSESRLLLQALDGLAILSAGATRVP